PAIAEDIQESGGEGAVQSAEGEGGEGGEGAAVVLEGRVGGEVGEEEEELDGEDVGEGKEDEGEEEGVHGFSMRGEAVGRMRARRAGYRDSSESVSGAKV
ncbi:hypothetical protein LTR33_018306, partial [Friedmanniomyces endolithicus]